MENKCWKNLNTYNLNLTPNGNFSEVSKSLDMSIAKNVVFCCNLFYLQLSDIKCMFYHLIY